MTLNPEFEIDEQKRLKTGFILQLAGLAAALPTGPIGLIVTLMGVWRVSTAVTDEKKGRWRTYLIVGIVCVLLEAAWIYFATNLAFSLLGGGGGGMPMPQEMYYGPGVG